jgi:hypothetical protein
VTNPDNTYKEYEYVANTVKVEEVGTRLGSGK